MDIGIYKSKVKEGVVAEMLAYKKEVPARARRKMQAFAFRIFKCPR